MYSRFFSTSEKFNKIEHVLLSVRDCEILCEAKGFGRAWRGQYGCRLWQTTVTEIKGYDIQSNKINYRPDLFIRKIAYPYLKRLETSIVRNFDLEMDPTSQELHHSSEQYTIWVDNKAGRSIIYNSDGSCDLLLSYGKISCLLGSFCTTGIKFHRI